MDVIHGELRVMLWIGSMCASFGVLIWPLQKRSAIEPESTATAAT